jgi:hypothetical protein
MNKKNSNKQPKVQTFPVLTKQPRVGSSIGSINNFFPSWHFDKLDLEYFIDWKDLDREELITDILPKLKAFEKLTWGEIRGRRNHFVPISSLISEAQRRLEQLKIEDIEELISLRFSGEKRLYGIQYESIIKILWWDAHHKICPSLLKYT